MDATWAIIVAGGRGQRFGTVAPKQFLPLGDQPLLQHSLQLFSSAKKITGIILVLPEEFVGEWREKLRGLDVRVTAGGATRQESVSKGLAQVPVDVSWIVIHDAARPFVTLQLLENLLTVAQEHGAAIPAIPVADTLKKGDDQGRVLETVDRQDLFRVQTPQVFSRDLLKEALAWAKENSVDGTDEAGLVEKMGRPVRLISGEEFNFKVTQPSDLEMAQALWSHRHMNGLPVIRIGEGYDVHRLVEGRPLILGGVNIPFEKGLLGHSDADALSHAIADALLGAAALGDLGAHFPDTDPRWKGANSLDLLAAVQALLAKKSFFVQNLDATLLCQAPKLAPHIPAMRHNLARVLKMDQGRISVKATTEEGLGFTGRQEGIAARAVALIGTNGKIISGG
jgi:2-C-methyl-D-erythritol 4-phosphate cytidylyltransferase/2-C-methyl-D-erythritol 2,4-cyclodiphosphate synthase